MKRFFVFVLIFLSVTAAFAQVPTGALRGQVTDPSGAAISGATVVMTPSAAGSSPIVVQTNGQGMYEFNSLAPGQYILTVSAQGFTLYENDKVTLAAQALRLNVPMIIEVETQKVQVSDTAPTIDVNPANNAGAITISGKELDALPDDPDELLTDLQALAGPSAGPNGGQMYIDGFTAGQLPPKSSIREIRINQNPFSAEYDKLGYGRIEILTKPGTDKLHGQFMVNGNDSAFNSDNPFIGSAEPPYYSVQYNGNVGGAIGKKASFFFNIDRRNINEVAAIVADDPATGLLTSSSLSNPRQRTNVGPRFDWAITKNNTLTVRYQYYRDTQTNSLGSSSALNLPSQAYYSKETEDTLQISDTQVYGSKIVNETRFQYNRDGTGQDPNDINAATNVLGSFFGGGSNSGTLNDLQNSYELQNYTSILHGNHTLKFGVRIRDTHDSNFSTAAFNGTFTFPSFAAFQASTPSQLAVTTGSPNASINYYDAEPYVQDDWRIRPNITLSLGMRFEAQNAISDHNDWAPRLGFAWGVHGRSKPPIVVVRGGFGIFYDRFQSSNILQADRLNGVIQQAYVINNPNPGCYPGYDQPFTFSQAACGQGSSTTYQIDPHLHAPYTLQSAVSVERQLTKTATLAVTYLNSRGFDQLLTLNADAPYPGTACYPNCVQPTSYLYRYASEANFSQNQLIANTNIRVGTKVQLFGYYTLNYAKSDTSGGNSFPSNSYDIRQDYGRGNFDIRNRLFLGGSIGLPYLFRLSPFMVVSSGSPYNIVSPYDLNGDGQYNNRPGLVSNATCPTVQSTNYIYCTPLGTFDASGATGKLLPINYGTGPNHFVMNLRLSKTIGLGPKVKAASGPQGQQGGPPGGGGGRGGGGPRGPLFGGGGPMSFSSNSDRRYNLTLSASARNAFNNVNLANPNSTLGSNTFGFSTGLQGGPFSQGSAANRKIELQATFSF